MNVPSHEGEREVEWRPASSPAPRRPARPGLPRLGGGQRGDQRIIIDVVVPTNLSEEQREIAERLDETLGPHNLALRRTATGTSVASAAPSGLRLIRLAVGAAPDQADSCSPS